MAAEGKLRHYLQPWPLAGGGGRAIALPSSGPRPHGPHPAEPHGLARTGRRVAGRRVLEVPPAAGGTSHELDGRDAGVWSLHVPQMDTLEIAHEVVNASLYTPDGLRGIAGIGNHTDYETGPVGETQRFLNAQIHLAIMFES
jgi:hypothetical protein